MGLVLTGEEVMEYISEVFPQMDGEFAVDHMDEDLLIMRLNVQEKHLRPGGTVSGPSMFSLADVSAYVATMGRIGREALTVTTNCAIDFMRKPEAGVDLLAHTRVLKIGRTLSISDCLIYSEGMAEPVARANMTYAIPPKKG